MKKKCKKCGFEDYADVDRVRMVGGYYVDLCTTCLNLLNDLPQLFSNELFRLQAMQDACIAAGAVDAAGNAAILLAKEKRRLRKLTKAWLAEE